MWWPTPKEEAVIHREVKTDKEDPKPRRRRRRRRYGVSLTKDEAEEENHHRRRRPGRKVRIECSRRDEDTMEVDEERSRLKGKQQKRERSD